VEQKRSSSSFVGGYLSRIPAHFDYSRLTVIDTQILHWKGFDAHVPACLPIKCIFRVHAFRSVSLIRKSYKIAEDFRMTI
jgi:hypothetical protein